MKSTTIAVDLAKSVFEVAVSSQPGQVDERVRCSRARFETFFANRPPATVLLEACGSAHHWGRVLERMGHDVRLVPADRVRPYARRGHKTDRADAKALLEAWRNEEIHAVPVKSPEQQAVASLHRLRSGWMETRTHRLNALRGLLREFGVNFPLGARRALTGIAALTEDSQASALPALLLAPVRAALEEIAALDQRIREVERTLAALVRQSPVSRQLLSAPGIGVLAASAFPALVGDIHRFRSSRQFASYVGLSPREHSSGSRRHLGRISKRGDVYLRTLLVLGARSVLIAAKRQAHPNALGRWALEVERRRGPNKAAVALANKLARTVWALWSRGETYRPEPGNRPAPSGSSAA
jgi:transposase